MSKNVDLLYIEDNEDYINFIGRAVKKINREIVYDYVTDGSTAVDYFEKNKNKLKLVLLDVNLPGIDGFHLLKKIRTTLSLQFLPVVMFSTSDNPKDIQNAYANGANAYLVKPSGISSLTEMVKTLCDFWLSLNHINTDQ